MRTALVTGASRGIGKATAIALAKSGHFDCIAINCLKNRELLRETAEEIRAMGITCLESCGNTGDYAYVKSLIDEVLTTAGKIDLLVNNAAISYIGLLTDMTPEEWDCLMKTNLTSVFNTCRLTVPAMVRAKSGRIINISSVWGITGASCEVAYSASKGAVNSFTKALAKELAPSNIAVNTIAFGAVDTEMNGHLSKEDRDSLIQEIPAGRMASPEEAGQAIVRLYEMPSYFTGEIIKFDGGWI